MLQIGLFYIFAGIWMVCGTAGHVLKRNTESSPRDGNEIHCYCNLPDCISTTYMCKTEKTESGCFKRFDPTTNRYDFGCLDSVSKQTICPKEVELHGNSTTISKSRNQCCSTDMCNDETVAMKDTISSVISVTETNDEEIKMLLSLKNVGQVSSLTYYTNSEVWFRAVLIAVPICGLIILLILIVIAVRILRSDSFEDRISSSKLIKQNYEISAVINAKEGQSTIPSQTCGFHSQSKFKYGFLPRWFPFVFKKYPAKHSGTKNAKYHFIARTKPVNNAHVSKVSEKFSQNLNILKLPYKFNELKHKSCNNMNINNASCNNNNNNNSNNNNHNYCSVTLNTNSSCIKKI